MEGVRGRALASFILVLQVVPCIWEELCCRIEFLIYRSAAFLCVQRFRCMKSLNENLQNYHFVQYFSVPVIVIQENFVYDSLVDDYVLNFE